jgi:PKD repeat protein
MRVRRALVAGCALLFAVVLLAHPRPALAVAVSAVTISPNVVPVPANPAQKTAVLISAAVSGVPAAATVSCTVTLTLQPSNTVIAVSPPTLTGPAPASGATTLTLQMLIPGLTPAGAAQATANCGASSGSVPFRITAVVAVSVAPQNVPAGGTTGISVMIAGGGALPATPCTLIVTAPPGAAPPLAVQTLTVSGGTATAPATTLVNLALPQTAPLGPANAAVSCFISGFGTAGDAMDFTITNPSVVTITSTTTPAVAGANLSVTSVTLPGFVCVALLAPAVGARITSAPATTNATGIAVNTITMPATIQAGTASLTVSCSDPTNPANTATSAALTLSIVGAVAAQSACAGLSAQGAATGPAPLAVAGGPYLGSAGEPVQFSAQGSLPSTGAVVTTCVWDFGDQTQATTLNPAHTYAASGVYAVTLTVSDSAGLSATASTLASIAPYLPLCSQPNVTGFVGLNLCASGGSCPTTSLPGQCLQACQTYLPANTAGATGCPQPGIAVQASAGGPYVGQVSQPVAFEATASASGTRRLCAADATLGTAGPVCNLAPAVALPSPVLYVWDFGDGGSATGANPSHTYSAAGTYRVLVSVQFDDGSIATGTAQAQIAAPPAGSS